MKLADIALGIAIAGLIAEIAAYAGHRWERQRWLEHRRKFEHRHSRANFQFCNPEGQIINGFAWIPADPLRVSFPLSGGTAD